MIVAMAAGLILVAQADVADDPAANLAALQQLYAQSCGSRGYAAYDDVCNQISRQIRQAEVELRRSTHAGPTRPSAPPPVAPAAAASGGTPPKPS